MMNSFYGGLSLLSDVSMQGFLPGDISFYFVTLLRFAPRAGSTLPQYQVLLELRRDIFAP
ncbi:hypothetical protein ACO0LL_10845 [Undibacterium sp. TC4M20W]|uniref:hypothetical protein n=1 Tax=unclassified Undibacterium TaxID=2630295 RepID=UPI003BF07D7C